MANKKYNLEKYTYAPALKCVLDVRDQRQKIYGDDWQQQTDWELLALIKMKLKRLEHFVIESRDEKVYEGRKDAMIDAVNYLLFLLQNELDKHGTVPRAARRKRRVVKRAEPLEKVEKRLNRPPTFPGSAKIVEQAKPKRTYKSRKEKALFIAPEGTFEEEVAKTDD